MASTTNPTTKPRPPFSKTRLLLLMTLSLLALGTILLLTLLALDVFTLPYLTPFAHFLYLFISPFIPLIFPAQLGLFLKVLRYRPGQESPVAGKGIRGEWSNRKSWLFVTACWVLQHVGRVTKDASRLAFGGANGVVGKGPGWEVDVCSIWGCKGPWVELVATLLVVVCEVRGWRWEGGLLDKWVEGMAVQSQEQGRGQDQQTTDGEVRRMEEGESGDNVEVEVEIKVDGESGEKEGLLSGESESEGGFGNEKTVGGGEKRA